MSRELLILLLWLGLSSVYLVDGMLLWAMLGPWASPRVRQGWLAAPLAFAFLTLVFTPWGIWAAAFLAGALALHLAAHQVGVRRVAAGLEPAPPELTERIRRLAARWGAPVPDGIWVDRTDRWDPGVMGLLRQRLILPRSALELPAAEFEAVLAHELAHVAARDPLKLWLTGFARTLLGWHPAARRLADGILLEIELAADRQAATWTGEAESYALTLGRWGLRQAGRPAPFGVALTGTSSQLLLRLQVLLHPELVPAHLAISAWVPGGRGAMERRARGPKPRREGTVRWLHGALSAGYLALFLLLLRLV
ncbi:MAG: M56 family metallopeptidase [Pseudomonadota bacterium]